VKPVAMTAIEFSDDFLQKNCFAMRIVELSRIFQIGGGDDLAHAFAD